MWNVADVIFVGCSLVTLPVYFTMLILLIRNRKSTSFCIPFYWLIISQGIADLLYLVTYVTFIIFAYIAFSTELDPVLTRIVTNVDVKILTFCLALRCLGIMLISFQRYTALCLWSSTRFMWVNKGSPIRIVAIQWVVSAVVIFPILPLVDSSLGPTREKALLFDATSFKVLMIAMYVSVFPTFVICIFCYGAVLREIFCKLRSVRSTSKKVVREVQLCIQAAAFVFAFFLLFAFYLYECILILNSIHPPVILQLIHPIVSGFLSFVVPWTLVFFNKEVAALFRKVFEMNQGSQSLLKSLFHFYTKILWRSINGINGSSTCPSTSTKCIMDNRSEMKGPSIDISTSHGTADTCANEKRTNEKVEKTTKAVLRAFLGS